MFARFLDWLLAPFSRIVARRVTDALDSAVLETNVGATSSVIVNALVEKRKLLAREAAEKRQNAEKVQGDAQRWHDNTVLGAARRLAEQVDEANDIRLDASFVEQDAAELARIQRTLRNGQ